MSGFVKLDCGMLNSTIWMDRPAREVFITALLMAEPREFIVDVPQIEVRTLSLAGWSAPPGWYGFVPAAGVGIVGRAGLDIETGLAALERLGSPEAESRNPAFDGRRMIRIDGGYIILNYAKFRERDYTATERSRRFRERRKQNGETPLRNGATPLRNGGQRQATQAEAEAEKEKKPGFAGDSDSEAPPGTLWTEGLNLILGWRHSDPRSDTEAPIFKTEQSARAWIGSLLKSDQWFERSNGHDYPIRDRDAKLLELIQAAADKRDPRAYVGGAVKQITGLRLV